MIILEDFRSLYNDIKGNDMHDQLAFNELAYGRRIGDHVCAFCPFCGKILEISAEKLEKEEPGKPIRLKRTVSCDCRRGLRYLRKGILEIEPPRPGLFARLRGKLSHGEAKAEDPLREIRNEIEHRWYAYQTELQRPKREALAEAKARLEKQREWEKGLHGLAGSRSAAGTGLFLCDSGGLDYNYQSDYIPDDFEPGLDPYDREALYEEEMLDDWIIAGGGDPFDYGDRMDAIADPFGFGDDFGDGDGFGGDYD